MVWEPSYDVGAALKNKQTDKQNPKNQKQEKKHRDFAALCSNWPIISLEQSRLFYEE